MAERTAPDARLEAAAVARFQRKDAQGLIDRDSGAWDFDANQRRVLCGRCGALVPKGDGTPYNEFMTDGYRASTHYLCRSCA